MGNKVTKSPSDYELIQTAKAGATRRERNGAKLALFERYRAMVMKHYHWLRKNHPEVVKDIGGVTGYLSEAYLALEKLIEKTPESILRGSPEKGGNRKILFFSWYLHTMNQSLISSSGGEVRPSLEDILLPREEEGEVGNAEEFFLGANEARPVDHESGIYAREVANRLRTELTKIPIPETTATGWTLLWETAVNNRSRASVARELGVSKAVIARVASQVMEVARSVAAAEQAT